MRGHKRQQGIKATPKAPLWIYTRQKQCGFHYSISANISVLLFYEMKGRSGLKVEVSFCNKSKV